MNRELVKEIQGLLTNYPILKGAEIDYEIAMILANWYLDRQREIYKECEENKIKELESIKDFINKKIYI